MSLDTQPQAIRTTLDVYGENVCKIVPIDSPQFGRVMAVCIGAMMVGSIKTTLSEGDSVKRGQEFGYFAFGMFTVTILLRAGSLIKSSSKHGRRLDHSVFIREECCRVGRGLVGQRTRISGDTRACRHGYWASARITSATRQRSPQHLWMKGCLAFQTSQRVDYGERMVGGLCISTICYLSWSLSLSAYEARAEHIGQEP